MTGATHAALGALAGAAIARASGTGDPLLAIAGAAGALLPDLDQPESRAWRYIVPYAAATIVLHHFAGIPVPRQLSTFSWLSLACLAAGLLTHHRGLTHSLLALAGMAIGLAAGGTGTYGIAAWLGALSHIGADAITPEGVRLLWPLEKRYRLPLLRTGSSLDVAIGTTSAAAAALLLLRW